jgi:putative transposase
MSRFAPWRSLTHTQRDNAHFGTTGVGLWYQGHDKSFPIQDDDHALSVCRYVKRNADTGVLCKSPETWKYGRRYRWQHGSSKEKSPLDARNKKGQKGT